MAVLARLISFWQQPLMLMVMSRREEPSKRSRGGF